METKIDQKIIVRAIQVIEESLDKAKIDKLHGYTAMKIMLSAPRGVKLNFNVKCVRKEEGN